jgi:hypothetical protein
MSTYLIKIRGHLDEADINAASPVELTLESKGNGWTMVTVQTDQSGMIGAIRHLHGLGIVLLSIIWSPDGLPSMDNFKNNSGVIPGSKS